MSSHKLKKFQITKVHNCKEWALQYISEECNWRVGERQAHMGSVRTKDRARAKRISSERPPNSDREIEKSAPEV